MNRLLYLLGLLAGLAAGALVGPGCYVNPGPAPVPVPVPPQPPQPPPQPPAPEVQVPRTTFDSLVVPGPAGQLSGLPEPERRVTLQDGTVVWSWVLDEPRPEGGWIRWEVHVQGDTIVLSMAY